MIQLQIADGMKKVSEDPFLRVSRREKLGVMNS